MGYILVPGSSDIFVHGTELQIPSLEQGDMVSYELKFSAKGNIHAKAVRACAGTRQLHNLDAVCIPDLKPTMEAQVGEFTDLFEDDSPTEHYVAMIKEKRLRDLDEIRAQMEAGCKGSVSVATYNVLHPRNATSFGDVEGVDQYGRSNWDSRAPGIAVLIRDGDLDAYLLQEAGLQEMVDLRKALGGERASRQSRDSNGITTYEMDIGKYRCVYITHPRRSAKDGVAVLLHSERLKLLRHHAVPLLGNGLAEAISGVPYMVAVAVLAQDSKGNRFVFASTHFYEKKTQAPQDTLLSFLDRRLMSKEFGPVDAVVWGADCNRGYGEKLPGYVYCTDGMPVTRPKGMNPWIDFIFASENCSIHRSAKTHRFCRSTGKRLKLTGQSCSDHRAEAVVVTLCDST